MHEGRHLTKEKSSHRVDYGRPNFAFANAVTLAEVPSEFSSLRAHDTNRVGHHRGRCTHGVDARTAFIGAQWFQIF